MNTRQALREQLHALWAAVGCFLIGATLGFIMLRGALRVYRNRVDSRKNGCHCSSGGLARIYHQHGVLSSR